MARNSTIVINVDLRETRVALIEDGVIAELHIERAAQRSTVGNIVLGKVTRVLPGMQAAFIDVGQERAAFLHVEDLIRPDDFDAYLAGDPRDLKGDGVKRSSSSASTPPEEDADDEERVVEATAESADASSEDESGADKQENEEQAELDETPARGRRRSRGRRRPRGTRSKSDSEPRFTEHQADSEAPSRRRREKPRDDENVDAQPDGDLGDATGTPEADSDAALVEGDVSQNAITDENDFTGAGSADLDGDLLDDNDEDDDDDAEDDDSKVLIEDDEDDDSEVLIEDDEDDDSEVLTEDDEDEDEDEDDDDAEDDDAEDDDAEDDDGDSEDLGEELDEQDADDEDLDGDELVGTEDGSIDDATEQDSSGEAIDADSDEDDAEPATTQLESDDAAADATTELRDSSTHDAGGPDEESSESGDAEDDDPARRGRRRRRRRRVGRGRTTTEQEAAPEPEEADGGARRGRRRRRRRGEPQREPEPVAKAKRTNGRRSSARVARSVPITEVVREGNEVIVQISKEPIGTKGARVTSHVSLPGRYVVYLPTVEHIGISKRIGNARERSRLRKSIEALKPKTGGLIVRTVAEGLTKKQLKADVGYLIKVWSEVANNKEGAKAPALLYDELDLVLKVARDFFTDEVEHIIIDDRDQYGRLARFIEMFMPQRVKDVKLYTGDEPVFDAYGIEDEIKRALSRKVPLPSGGSLIMDQAEALTAIDVNTGRYVGKGSKDLEETALKTNLEAVDEIAYQLRFRNIGGLVILDLIDMERASNRDKVWRKLEQALAKDKAKTTINRISELGLIEMTRKRTRESLGRTMNEPCFYCDGTGHIQSRETIAYEILRQIRRDRMTLPGYSVRVHAHPAVVDFLKFEARDALQEAERRYTRRIELVAHQEYHIEQYDLQGK